MQFGPNGAHVSPGENQHDGGYSHDTQDDEGEQNVLQAGPMASSPGSFMLRLICIHIKSAFIRLYGLVVVPRTLCKVVAVRSNAQFLNNICIACRPH